MKRHENQLTTIDQDMILPVFSQFARAKACPPFDDKSLYPTPEGWVCDEYNVEWIYMDIKVLSPGIDNLHNKLMILLEMEIVKTLAASIV